MHSMCDSRDAKMRKKRAKRVSRLTTRRKKTPVDKLQQMAARPVPIIHVSDYSAASDKSHHSSDDNSSSMERSKENEKRIG